jgi:hypothetical protein
MQKIILEAPFNSLSFGNVSYNLLREFWKKRDEISLLIYPIGKVDFSVFDKMSPDMLKWFNSAVKSTPYNLTKDKIPSIKLWHLSGSETKIGDSQTLYTFHELDAITPAEVNVVNRQYSTIFSSSHSASLFKDGAGCTNVQYCGLGFDEDFNIDPISRADGVVHFGLMGKFEKRKHTREIVQIWLENFGNNPKYQLSLAITNPFIPEDKFKEVLRSTLGNTRWNNVNLLPFMKKNSYVAQFLNSIDIDLSGLSGAEGWNLPSFNATCMGKWSIVLNHTSHKDWATEENCILIEPNGVEPAEDGLFFSSTSPFNQGNIYTFDKDKVSQAMRQAVIKSGQVNSSGLQLKESHSYKNLAETLIKSAIESC